MRDLEMWSVISALGELKAVKSCLMCLASYCETHLQPHYEVPPLKKHKLVQASTQLQEKICSHHDKLLEVYCRTDQQCICYLCTMYEHKGHDTVSAAAERTEKMKQLGEKSLKCQKRIQAREKEIQELRKAVDSVKVSVSLCVSPGSEVLPSITVYPHSSFEHVKSVSKRKDQLEDICRKEMATLSGKVTTVQIGPPAEPKTREDFLSYTCQLTLDPNTAYQNLCLSEGNRRVTWSDKVQSYTDHPDRFTPYKQVLCREGLSGVCYWEVEWSGGHVGVAVSYKEISRKHTW
ncbi:hypothetical protein DPEC_G00154090 [Dallia pectoralis]|uniref:Uncharacterized protein n=1 Tax=Dallia pectoralis TaxID=75939 RepID=A0ACC2GKI8_DALPE|nr:hypothetical protein DPEC_G00154090 [Dallia pectoralis]